ncbi:MAG: lipopolysaccharide heptosyltransferase II [Deltaproteobacteria bacterium HGW-Deltaproteobacteria-19]|jgi:lipopolysaccharide heptosyltransferase I|nr:MAG: lipopolysaccharide heptosyltransferase II [Deltaproteobacteria bacterium HGW-Deltaproteobacteria-19]
MNILLVKLSSIGDVVHTLPSLAALRNRYPEAHITWVVEEESLDIIQGNPKIDRILVSGRKRWARRLKEGRDIGETLGEIRRFLRELRDRPYDVVIDFMGLLKSAILVFASRGRQKLGYDSMQEMSALFYNEKIPEDMGKHAVDRYLDFARHLGAQPAEPEFYLYIPEESRIRAEALLRDGGVDPESPFAVLSPMSYAGETRLWEDDRFAALGDRIRQELGWPTVITGHESGGRIGRIAAAMGTKALNLENRTTLKELAHLYHRAAVVVTPDSGPMHIAAAVGTPVVALFGASDPARTGPYGKIHTVIRADLPCSPCFKKTCDTRQCMKDISVNMVLDAVRRYVGPKEIR